MSNKIALMTGAADEGYGQAVTTKLIENGYDVIGTYQSDKKETALKFSEGLNGLSVHEVNLENRNEIDEYLLSINDLKIDLLINSQMFYEEENQDDFDHAIWDKSIAINLTAPNYIFHKIHGQIIQGGSIISITSIDGYHGSFGASAYAVTKAAMHNLIKSLCVNFGNKFRVNAVAAGWINDVMGEFYEPFDKNAKEFTPMKRNGEPGEVAEAVFFLASQAASFINGQIITVDGGYSNVDYVSKCEMEFNKK